MLLQSLKEGLLRASPFFLFFGVGLVALSLSRIGLATWQASAVSEAHGWMRVLIQGVRVDIATMCMFLGLAACLYLALPDVIVRHKAVQFSMACWLAITISVLVMLELATPAFMQEYGLRPNRLFIEYLIYPREVLSTLGKGHLASSLTALAVTGLTAWLAWRLASTTLQASLNVSPSWITRAALAVTLLLLTAGGIRSTLGHRPMNPAMHAFSSNATVNVLPLNSFYSVSFAARDWLKSDPGSRVYGSAADEEIVRSVLLSAEVPSSSIVESELPVLIRRAPIYKGKPRNLVIILEESLGAQFVGNLGGLPLTPNLDRLSEEGWAFERLYATGTRSVRGIEAVLTGFTPTPSQAVVKQPLSQQNFFTIADVLKRRGFDTTFYYGGESHFDNMRGFFLSNGFQRVVDRKDYDSPVFVGSWGVSDEDLLDNAHRDFERMHKNGEPFFGFVFTSSNHDPFEFPEGRIELHERPKATRNNAAKYADYALGKFFDQAKQAEYWEDTIFLVVADHDSRAFGRDLVPIDNFHIPGLILGAGVVPRRDARIVSQIDLPPTLLSLVGIDEPTPMIGQDLNDPDRLQEGRALMQYDSNFALMRGESVAILQPGQPASTFTYARPGGMRHAETHDLKLETEALHVALWGTLAYQKGWHRASSHSDE